MLQETGDQIVILTYVCSSAVNCIIALQVILPGTQNLHFSGPRILLVDVQLMARIIQLYAGAGVLELCCKEENRLKGCGSEQCKAQSIALFLSDKKINFRIFNSC